MQPSQTESQVLRRLAIATAPLTGIEFFRALVRQIAQAIGTDGAWITEYDGKSPSMRAVAFWMKGEFVEGYEYPIAGTPCEVVIRDRCLAHFPERVVELFPGDNDLGSAGAVSYIGVPIFDDDGRLMGHLSAIDSKPLPASPRLISTFEIFADRAAAEYRRMRAEGELRDREALLNAVFESAVEAIVVVDSEQRVLRANSAAQRLFACEQLSGTALDALFAKESAACLSRSIVRLLDAPQTERRAWLDEPLLPCDGNPTPFEAEVTLSVFDGSAGPCATVILRDLTERRAAQRRIEELSAEAEYLRESTRLLSETGEMLGRSPEVLRVYDSIARVAPANTTVLIHGETGTGKELVARAIHKASPRAPRPMVRVNCAAIPHALIESEFFGHERGAFTGATQRREGRFALAHGGTIFLDEIGELPLDLQAKLLRVLQEGEFEPVGSSRTIKTDVRVVAATNRDLPAMIQAGTFREDLYYRLGVFPITLPPLRDRGSDVVLLAAAFAQRFAAQMGVQIEPLGPGDARWLRAYHWPGNIRELQNVIERAILLARGGRMDLAAAMPMSSPPAPDPASTRGDITEVFTDDQMREFERQNIARALKAAGGKISGETGAAQLLGIPASTLTSRMKALGMRG